MKPGGRGLNDSAIATASDPRLVDVRAPVGPDVGANHARARAHRPQAERAHDRFVGQPIGVERRAVVTAARAAIDQQIPTAVAADVPHGHRPEGLDYASGGHAARISTGQQADKQCLASSR